MSTLKRRMVTNLITVSFKIDEIKKRNIYGLILNPACYRLLPLASASVKSPVASIAIPTLIPNIIPTIAISLACSLTYNLGSPI